MKSREKKNVPVLTKALNSLAMVMVWKSANSGCMWMVHQPEFPKEARKFQRRKK